MGISLWIDSLAALTSVAAEGTTSVLGGGDATIVLVAGATTLEVGAGADIVCRRKGNLSIYFYADFTATAGITAGAATGAATAGTNRISF